MTLLDEVRPNPFEEVVRARRRPGFAVEPVSIAWDAVVLSVSGDRDAVACVPREALGAFFDDLDAGRLDDTIHSFLAEPPAGRVLCSASQRSRPRLFDSMGSPGAAIPSERVPGRSALGGIGGGTPMDARRNKNRRGRPRRLPSPTQLLVGAAAVAVIGVGVAVARSDDNAKPVAAIGVPTTRPAGPGSAAAGECHEGLCGTWEAVAEANIGTFPQTIHITTFDESSGKFTGDVNGSFIVEGVLNGDKMVWNYTGGSYRADFETTVSGSGVGATFDGTFTDNNGSFGSFSATRTQA